MVHLIIIQHSFNQMLKNGSGILDKDHFNYIYLNF